MRMVRPILVLFFMGVVLSCRRAAERPVPSAAIRSIGCGTVPGEVSALRPLPDVPAADADEPSRLGSLLVHVRSAGPDHPPLPEVTVALYRDTVISHAEQPVRHGLTASEGYMRLDSLPQGTYGLVLRRIGYVPIKDLIRVSAGVVAPIHATLARERVC